MKWFTPRYLAAIPVSVLVALLVSFGPVWAQDGSDDGTQANQIFLPVVNRAGEAIEQTVPPPAMPEITFDRTDQIIVRYAGDVQAAAVDHIAQVSALSAVTEVELAFVRELEDNAIVVKLEEARDLVAINAIVADMLSLPEVDYAEPDLIMQTTRTPNDATYANQWHYFAPVAGTYGANLPGAWDITTGSASIVVAVIDNGILPHAELAGRTVAGYDFIADSRIANDGNGRDNNPSDPGDWVTSAENSSGFFAGCGARNSSWHGTHVAGTIAANSNNATGVAGINWQSKILPVRVLGKCGGYTSDIVDGIRWAAGLSVRGVPVNANRARVINLSLGGSGTCGSTYQNAINAVVNAGTVVVVAAGNSNANAANYSPASCANVITVASTGRTGSRAPYSNYGATVEISAPGGDTSTGASNGILSTLNTGTTTPGADAYAYYQGTSMATPHVVGIVSLLLSVNPNLTPAQVTTLLQANITPFPAGSTCTTANCGPGIVNATAAVSAANAQISNPPSAFAKSSPATGSSVTTASATLGWAASVGATSYQYCIDSTSNSVCDTTWTNAGSATSATVANLQIGTTYSWQVRAVNANGTVDANGGSWWSFVRVGTPPGAFNQSSPGNGQANVSVSTTLRWNASTGATSYEYCIDTTNNNSCDGTWRSTGTARQAAISGLARRTSYYWLVRGVNSAGTTNANGGTWWRFTTR